LRILSLFLIIALLSSGATGLCISAHAVEKCLGDHESINESIVDPHDSPSCPLEQHNDFDGCDTCINCSCHATLIIQPFLLSYNPITLDLRTSDPFKHLPEVYLDRFIPPQNQA